MPEISKQSSSVTRFTRTDLHAARKDVDLQIIADWIPTQSRVLDLGCGRGLLLEQLTQEKQVFGIGVDLNPIKARHAAGRGISVYQGDLNHFMGEFTDDFFDYVILSRTLQDLPNTEKIVQEALRVGKNLIVGFINYAFWSNRLNFFLFGRRVQNSVYPNPWYRSEPFNAITIKGFEEFCAKQNYKILRKAYLKGDWQSRVNILPNLFAGYGLYQITATS